MKFTITATVTYDVDVDGETAKELVNYCHKHNCELGDALWFKQFHDYGFNLYDNFDCDVSESNFSTESITYEGMNDYDDVDDFIASTADAYGISKLTVAAILNNEWYGSEYDEDDE